MFKDYTYDINEMINYAKEITIIEQSEKIILRDYQQECIDIINKNKNCIICLPTGTGKNIVIIYSMIINQKYLILVPLRILMEQFKNEISKVRPELNNDIQNIGDGNCK